MSLYSNKQILSNEINALKAIAIIGVLFIHSNFQARFANNTLELIFRAQIIFGWCVVAFFFCSGYLSKSLFSIDVLLVFLKNRFRRLIIPCLIFSFTYKIILYFISIIGLTTWNFSIPTNTFDKFIFLISPISPQFYFLYYLFAISSLFSILLWLTSIKTMSILVSFFLIISQGMFKAPPSAHGPIINLIPVYTAGYLLGYLTSNRINPLSRMCAKLVILSIFTASILGKTWIPLYILIPYFLWHLFNQRPCITELINITNLGEYSSSIFVWHAPVLLPFMSIVGVKLIGTKPIVVPLILLFTLLACICLRAITNKYVLFAIWRY